MRPRRRNPRLAMMALLLLGASGCGGGVPATGTQVTLPPNYKEREKELSDGFKAMMKQQAAAKQKGARDPGLVR